MDSNSQNPRNSKIGQGRTNSQTKASSSEVAFQPNSSELPIWLFGLHIEDYTQKDEEKVHHELATRTEEDYVEPWHYENSYYLTVLPLRKPYSVDPERLDQEEFGEVAKIRDYEENTKSSAKELDLTSLINL